jgi:hypothetical protein
VAAAALREKPIFEYPPLRVKQAVVGLGRASVSGSSRTTSAMAIAANTAQAAKAVRQPHSVTSSAPTGGPVSANSPSPLKARAITRAPCEGSCRSRTTARAQTTDAAMPTPCKARQAISTVIVGASALATVAST